MNIDKTMAKASRYWWKDMRKDMAIWHKECYECQLRAPKRYKIPLVMTKLDRPFERIGMDVCGPLHMTSKGNLHYMLAIDEFTKYAVVEPIPDTKAVTVAKAFWEEMILPFGVPEEVLTDNAKTFSAAFFKEMCDTTGDQEASCTPYHSAGNAIAERPFRTFHDIVAKYMATTDLEWDTLIKEAACCYNMTPHDTTGESPFYLMFGRDPKFPVEDLFQVSKKKGDTMEVQEYRRHLVKTLETAIENAKKQRDKQDGSSEEDGRQDLQEERYRRRGARAIQGLYTQSRHIRKIQEQVGKGIQGEEDGRTACIYSAEGGSQWRTKECIWTR